MLPAPTISFTIPSIHDDLPLSCRIYHPLGLCPEKVSQIPEKCWRKKAAIVAHPYAPLGGCYDDPVVDLVAGVLLKEGYIVGTFNFRGAGDSKGHTSWQSKPEQNDYLSMLAFTIYYIHHLVPPSPASRLDSSWSDLGHDLSPVPSQCLPPPHLRIDHTYMDNALGANTLEHLIVGGFSYGALIAMFLPSSLTAILEPFQHPQPGSPHSEIRLRAAHFATEQSSLLATQLEYLLAKANTQHKRGRSQPSETSLHNPKTRQASSGVRVGGEEDLRRASHDSYRPRNSFNLAETPEKVRKSIDRVRSLARDKGHFASATSPIRSPTNVKRQNSSDSYTSFDRRTSKGQFSSAPRPATPPSQDPNLIPVQPQTLLPKHPPSYLLISPPINYLSGLASLWSSASRAREAEIQHKLTDNPTLAIFSDNDEFVSVRRFRTWADKLAAFKSEEPGDPGSDVKGEGDGNTLFRYREIPNGGHFWRNREAVAALKEEIKRFVYDYL